MCLQREGRIISCLYVVIVVESATIGLVLNETFEALSEYIPSSPERRDAAGVLLLTFIVIAMTGHILTIPWLCYATHNHSPSAFIPYMAWRMLLSCLTLGVVIWQSVIDSTKSSEFIVSFQKRMLPLAIVQVIVGVMFFGITLHAHAHFIKRRMLEEMNNQNADNCTPVYY
ncbi:hypothetical protein Tcan_02917 [Toxocara canis]|uniref:Uncharacterized protein n=1 Tax=Toxocara canis TaxID=6265 RepID=A0A0B2V449_TOXCA|nr:hypothetical protein Tcan_02917 [Toxocara canis]